MHDGSKIKFYEPSRFLKSSRVIKEGENKKSQARIFANRTMPLKDN